MPRSGVLQKLRQRTIMKPSKRRLGHGEIDAQIEERIGAQLRNAFAPIMQEPLPDRFIELLDQLVRSEEGK